jgi:hypothetical protein
MPDVPLNIQEFNQIAGLIFTQLYGAFPVVEDIERARIAASMGVAGNDWSEHKLPSGRDFNEMLAHTIGWLNNEDYIRAYGAHPSKRVVLTTKGLSVMNAIPSGLKEPLGTELTRAVEQHRDSKFDLGRVGDLMGGFFGGLVKSIGSG